MDAQEFKAIRRFLNLAVEELADKLIVPIQMIYEFEKDLIIPEDLVLIMRMKYALKK